MYAAPGMLRTMLLGIVPTEIENEVMDKPELEHADYITIFNWIKKRIEYKRAKMLAEFARKTGGGIVASVSTGGPPTDGGGAEYPAPVDPFAALAPGPP